MMNRKQRLSFLFGLFILLSLRAEPLNVFVGDLTFTRPATWEWKAPNPRSPAVTGFVVPGNGSQGVDVRFYAAGPEPETAVSLWIKYVAKEDQKTLRSETKIIGQRTIFYAFVHGTLILPGEKPLSGQAFVGVVIPWKDKFVHIRFSGPQDMVEKTIPTLKAMVQSAVEERESDLNHL